MNLEDIKETMDQELASGSVLRRMDCGCITFPEPIQDKHYLVMVGCDTNMYDYEPMADLGFFIREFPDHNIAESKLIPAGPIWSQMNLLMGKGVMAMRLKRQLGNLLTE